MRHDWQRKRALFPCIGQNPPEAALHQAHTKDRHRRIIERPYKDHTRTTRGGSQALSRNAIGGSLRERDRTGHSLPSRRRICLWALVKANWCNRLRLSQRPCVSAGILAASLPETKYASNVMR